VKCYQYYRISGMIAAFIPSKYFFHEPAFWVKGAIIGMFFILAEIRETWEHE
jgi:hypothetical protein